MSEASDTIRKILVSHGKLVSSGATLRDDDDLYQHGLSSHASVNVMLALEDEFDVEFPDSLLRRGTFRSISAIRDAVDSLTPTSASLGERA
jgi:acyl carrier protein